MLMPSIMNMPRRGIMRVLVIVAMAILLVMAFCAVIVAVAFGVGGRAFCMAGLVFVRHAAGEEEGGGEEGKKRTFHVCWILGLLRVACVQSLLFSFCLIRCFQRTYQARWCRLMRKYTSNAPAVAMVNMLRPTATPIAAVHQMVAAVVRPLE